MKLPGITTINFILADRVTIRQRWCSAFTLIEMLAVIMILGLITSIATWSVSNAADHSVLKTLADRWRIFDSNARLLAQRSGSAVLIEHDPWQRSMRTRDLGERFTTSGADSLTLRFDYGAIKQIQSVQIQRSVFTTKSSPILIDRNGRSQDYTVFIQFTESTPQSSLTIHISGMTGIVRTNIAPNRGGDQ